MGNTHSTGEILLYIKICMLSAWFFIKKLNRYKKSKYNLYKVWWITIKVTTTCSTTRIRNKVVWHLWGCLCATPWCYTATSWGITLPWILRYNSQAFPCSLVHMLISSICSLVLNVLSWYKQNYSLLLYLDFFLLNIIFWDASKLMFIAIFFPLLYNIVLLF